MKKHSMSILFVLICRIALVSLGPDGKGGKKKDKKSAHGAVSKPPNQGKSKGAEWTKSKGAGKSKGHSWNNATYSKKGKTWSNANYAGGQTYKYKTKVKTKHYDLSYKYNPKIQNV